jgi:sterol desaturase/sphingolipid hydroxylase (fatty acid hydroxylase superfamily)
MYELIIMVVLYIIIIYSILLLLSRRHKNFQKRKITLKYHCSIILNLIISTCIFITLLQYRKRLFHEEFFNVFNIIIFLLIGDTVSYWVHRVIHRTPTMKKLLHLHHHIESIYLIPLDSFNETLAETILYQSLIFIIPLMFIHLSFAEFMVASFIIFVHQLYTHSDTSCRFPIPLFISSKYHKLHHTVGNGNYSLFFPIWDNFMGTRIRGKRRNKKIKMS